MAIRVIHAGTGLTGREALRGIIRDPALELVGVYVTTRDKVGQDAGALCGLEEIGVAASGDLAAMFALEADCLSYAGSAAGRELDACKDMAAFLERGTNVVTFSVISMINPSAAPADLLAVIEAGCQAGGSSFYATGTEPGVGSLNIPAAMMAFAGDVKHYQMDEYALGLDTVYPVWDVLHESMGFGKPADFVPARISGGVVQRWWEPVVRFIAELLRVPLDKIEFEWETAVAPHDLDTAVGVITAGTICSFRWSLTGIVRGAPAVVVQYIGNVSKDAYLPDGWPRPAADTENSALVFKIEGRPNIKMQLYFESQTGEQTLNSSVAMTAMAAVNAIPAVVEAKPGIVPPLVQAAIVTRQSFLA